MRIAAWLIAAALALIATGCSSRKSSPDKSSETNSKTMPSVTGTNLQVAEDAIEAAGGDPDKIKVIGGGTVGIVVKSNWQVCSQSPEAGEALPVTPQFTVERICPSTSNASSAPASSTTASGGSSTLAPLTAKTSRDLARLLKVADNCSSRVKAFATKYAGRVIEFDGSISAMTNIGGSRYDLLLAPGDEGAGSDTGPTFQFQNVNTADLHFTDANAPDSVRLGDKLHLMAQVGEYDSTTCLFRLTPVSTRVR